MAKSKSTKKSHKCEHCGQVCKSKGGLKQHINAKHPKVKSIGEAAEDSSVTSLSLHEEKFCQLYASAEEFFGNGTQSYIAAFSVKIYKGKKPKGAGNWMTYNSVRDAARRLLTRTDILERINEVMEDAVLNDTFVDKQLAFLVNQNAELPTKLGAIREYNNLKQRITQKHEHKFPDLEEMSDKELKEEERRLINFFTKKKSK